MASIKTAISIEEGLFNEAEKLSEKLNLSRSQLFSQALEYFINKSETLDIIKRLNEVHADEDIVKEQKKLAHLSQKKMKGIAGKW